MTGPEEDCSPNLCAWGMVLSPMVLFFYAWGGVLLRSSPGFISFVMLSFASTIFFFLLTSFTDPGIIARGEKPEKFPPLVRQVLRPDGSYASETWCHTCNIYRPERASHCRDCDNCVREFDHHCPFTRNCIGARNYASFICFLLSVCLSLGVLFVACVYVLPTAQLDANGVLGGVRVPTAVNAMLIVFSTILSLFLWAFTGYHVVLVLSGLTTKEHLKGRAGAQGGLWERCESCVSLGIPPSELAGLSDPQRLVQVSDGKPATPTAISVPVIGIAQL